MEQEKRKTDCYHCGDLCDSGFILWDEKNFCCHGCRTVYEILNDNDLTCYYDLESSPGNNVKEIESFKYEFLDAPDIREKLLDFDGDAVQKFSFYIPSIHCSSCIWLLDHLSRLDEGIISSKVNFSKKRLSLTIDTEKTSLRKTAELVSRLGYEPVINLNTVHASEVKSNSQLFLQIGIAGFCFGNIMLFSFPDYLGMPVEESLKDFFSHLSIALALPVLIYSSREYFISALKGLKGRFANIDIPIAMGISALFLRSTYEILSQTGPGYLDSMTGLVFFLLIGKWIQGKTYEGMSFDRDFRSYFPLAVLKIDAHEQVSTPVYHLEIGDRIKIRNNEIIPADSVLMSDSARIDYSFVTGEQEPVFKESGDRIFAGGRIIGQAAEFNITKKVSQSYLTELWNDKQDSENEIQSQSLIDSISKYFTLAILAIATISGLVWMYIDSSQAVLVFTAVLIVACPCALALATPFTLGTAMNIFGRNNFYLKNTSVLEKLWSIDHIIFDKTGTITSNTSTSEYVGSPLTDKEREALKAVAANSVHPYSQLVLRHITDNKQAMPVSTNFEEISNKGIFGSAGGIDIKLGSNSHVNSCENNLGEAHQGNIFLSINDQLKGSFSVINHYRTGLRSLVDKLGRSFKLSLISGDSEKEKSLLQGIFPGETKLLFNQKPHHKAEYVDSLQSSGHQVMMLGDGLNDGIALKQADVGVAVTDNMSSFTPASDAILNGNSLNKLYAFLNLAKVSRKVIVFCFIISFLYNLIGLSFAISGALTPLFAAILMPLSSVTVVVIATMSTRFWARRILTT